mmetsp:Transcript_36874/g.62741  ORF Transcript_36874/g.62741 Transcript_36874/m.62741 type:complete len:282 (-) Transcript_36874:1702-2547(-)
MAEHRPSEPKCTSHGADGASTAGSSDSGGVLAKKYNGVNIMAIAMQQISLYYSKAKAFVYDTAILRMTEKWYRSVLERVDTGSILLDVGIGTGGALLRCADLIESRDLKVVGIDIDAAYVEAGKFRVRQAGLSNRISIDKVNVYEGNDEIINLCEKMGATADSNGGFVDAVYFSGSLSLLPDPIKALKLASSFVKRNVDKYAPSEKEAIYITQTYQRKTPFFLPYVKPLMKYATTIDFGQLVREEDILQTFKDSSLDVVKHEVIPGSVNNSFQAAYLSVLR